MDNQGTTEKRQSKEELLEQISNAYNEMEETLRPLSEEQLARPGSDGWAVKDHLSHLADWEAGVADLLQGKPRFSSSAVEEAEAQGKSVDEVNEIIYAQNTGLSAAKARAKYQAAHRQMLDALQSMSDDDLYKPYAAFLPNGEAGPQDPIINWIVSNTYEHYDEHNGWIRKLLESQS